MNMLEWLQNWYFQHCDGDWEHNYGIKIDTLDNPGWLVEIDLTDTDLEFEPFEKVEVEYSEQDWIHCRVQDGVFRGAGGPNNLQDILEIFYKWASRLESPDGSGQALRIDSLAIIQSDHLWQHRYNGSFCPLCPANIR